MEDLWEEINELIGHNDTLDCVDSADCPPETVCVDGQCVPSVEFVAFDVDLSKITVRVGGEYYTVNVPDEPTSTRVELVKEVTKYFQNGLIR